MKVFIGNETQGGVTIELSFGDIVVSEHRKGGLLSTSEARLMADTLYLMADHLEVSNNGH